MANKLLSRKSLTIDPIGSMVEKISSISSSRSFNDEGLAKLAISTESLDTSSEQVLINVYNNLEASLKAVASDFGIAIEEYQTESATIAGILASNPKVTLNSKLNLNTPYSVIPAGVTDGYLERPISLEAYDERENRNAQTYSIIYNLLSSRQDDFGETFFPTIVVNPNEVGVTVSSKIFYVYNDFKRSVTGSLARYARKNVVRAYADNEILKNELTRIVPVLRNTGGADDNTAKFVPATDVAPWTEFVSSEISVTTSALRTNTSLDLLGISQTNELLNSGIMGPSDTLDTYLKLKTVFIKVTDGSTTDVFAVDVENVPSATFTFAPQGNYRTMLLNLNSDAFVLTGTTTNVAGTALSASSLTELSNRKARIRISVTGTVSLDKADCIVNGNKVELVALRDSSDNLITGAIFTSLASKLDTATIIGYTLIAYRANSNLRQRGQLLDSQIEYQIIQLPYRSPLSVIMPSFNNGTEDNAALQTLITVTGIRVSNEAVTTLLNFSNALASYSPVADSEGNMPEIAAIGRFYVKPTYFSESIDLAATVDSIKSHERIKDIRAALVEKIRYYANEMYRASEYKAAAFVLTGNTGFKPTVIIGTDPVIYNYIMADGDLRTLGETFDVKVVATLDKRVKGKVFITFGVFDSSRNTSINPLNFGNMLWSPELTVVMPISRDGQVSKELIVSPRFAHIVNLPVMTTLTVSGLPTVTGKVSVNMHNV